VGALNFINCSYSRLTVLQIPHSRLHSLWYIWYKRYKYNLIRNNSSPSPEDQNRSRFRKFMFSSSNYLESGRWTKSKNLLILCVIHHRQNHTETVWFCWPSLLLYNYPLQNHLNITFLTSSLASSILICFETSPPCKACYSIKFWCFRYVNRVDSGIPYACTISLLCLSFLWTSLIMSSFSATVFIKYYLFFSV
jgi:hypothetical protein